MSTRTTETTVTFRRAASFISIDRRLSPGTYRVTMDEEAIPGLSFVAYRRTATMLYTPAIAPGTTEGAREVFLVDSAELDDVIAADARD